MKLLLSVFLLTYSTVYAEIQPNKGHFNFLSKTREKRVVTLDKTFKCPEGWNLSFRTCYKSFAPPVKGMTHKMVYDECKKLGATPAALRNSAEEIGVQKSLKMFRNSSKTSDLIIIGTRQTEWIETKGYQSTTFGTARYLTIPFWMGVSDIDDQRSFNHYNKFIPQQTPASVLANRKPGNFSYSTNDPALLRCLTYDSESMLMDEIKCDCSKYNCKNPHEITAVTCSEYAEFNGVSLRNFFNETSKFQSIPEYTKKYKCDPDWTLVVNNATNYTNIGIEAICMKAFRPPYSYVTYHSSEQLCAEHDARPSTPNSDMEAKAAIGLLDGVYGYTYNASVYVGIRLLENFVAFEDVFKKAFPEHMNELNEYVNDWAVADWNVWSDPPAYMRKKKVNETIYVPLGEKTTVGLFQKAKYMEYPNDPAYNTRHHQHYCVIWDVKYGYRAWYCDPNEWSITYPVKAVMCSKLPTWKFFPTFCANKTQTV